MEEFFKKLKIYENCNLEITVDSKFKKLSNKFKINPNNKTYDKLIKYLREISNKNKIEISNKLTLVYSDKNLNPIFNSELEDNKYGNNYNNYLEEKINFDNKYQKKSAIKSNIEIINVTVRFKKNCENKYRKYFYISNYIDSHITIGENSYYK